MQAKKSVCFFSVLLLLSMLLCSVDASSGTAVLFRGGGVTVELTYPEEAHQNTTITHNVTITAHTDLSLQSFTLFIYAPVNATWQEVKNRTISWDFLENETLTSRIEFQLPQDANGTLYCEMTVKTDRTADTLFYKFYTTRVSELTFSEMQTLYYEMLANYTGLREDYDTLFSDYNELYVNYTSLFVNYTTLLDDYDQLVVDHGALQEDYDKVSASYESLNTTYMSLLSEHNQLTTDYNSKVSDYDTLYDDFRVRTTELGNLQTVYNTLNGTYYSLQTDFNKLQIDSSTLNQTYHNLLTDLADLQNQLTDSQSAVNVGNIVMFIFVVAVAALIAFIVYIKRKQEDPYLVIRKETVSMKSDEET
jgi:predicted nuclease with TOPRIM domain